MAIVWADLARTPSGALTAASKRTVEAERVEDEAKRRQRYQRQAERRVLVAALVLASDELEAFDNDEERERAETDRESRAYDRAYVEGVKDGKRDALDDYTDTALTGIDQQLHRLMLGLDADLTAAEMLEQIQRGRAA